MEPLNRRSIAFLTHLKKVADKALSKIPFSLSNLRFSSGQPNFPEQINWLAPPIKSLLQTQRQWTTLECGINTGRQIFFHLSSPHRDTPKLREKLVNRVQKCCAWLSMATAYAESRCSENMHIYMFFTDAKKMLPIKKGLTIDTEHANTAFTTSCQTDTSILLYREEEWFKVFIHETFHNLGLDFSSQNITPVKKALVQHYKIRSDMRIYESYCEVWADILNVLFTRDQDWIQAIEAERQYSLKQAGKIFQHFGLTYADLGTTKATSAFNENTEIFCYFVVRSLWMWGLNRFLTWCLTYNHGSLRFQGDVKQFVQHMIFAQNPTQAYLHAIRPLAQASRSLRMTLYG